jgi:shikimate kinase
MRSDVNLKNSPTVSFMPPKTIVLVGLMGCGKTSIGKRLAKRLELPFYDSDQEVELAAGCTIKDILEIYGEEAFSSGETRVIKRLLGQSTHILATGGGSFMIENTRNLIKENAISVWLNADLETLLARVSRRADRPTLSGCENDREILEKLIAERYSIFSKSDVCVETFDEPTNSTVDRVINSISNYIKDNYPNYYVLKSV